MGRTRSKANSPRSGCSIRRDHSASDSDSNSATHRAHQRVAEKQRRFDRPVACIGQFRPKSLVKRLDHGLELGQRQPGADIPVHLCVRQMVHNLPDGPASRPYGVSSRSADKPATAARSRAGASASCRRSWRRSSSPTGGPASNGPIGYRRSVKFAGSHRDRLLNPAQTCESSIFWTSDLPMAPTRCSTTWPPLNNSKVGCRGCCSAWLSCRGVHIQLADLGFAGVLAGYHVYGGPSACKGRTTRPKVHQNRNFRPEDVLVKRRVGKVKVF